MINLIPPEGFQAVRREYVLRVLATMALLFSCIFLFLSIALIPTYVLMKTETSIFAFEVDPTSDINSKLIEAETEVRKMTHVLAQLKVGGSGPLPSTVIEAIQESVPNGVVLKNFEMNMASGRIQSVVIQGSAPTRESLVRLRTEIEALPLFGKAEVPLSDLAKDTDLPFVMSITLPQEKK